VRTLGVPARLEDPAEAKGIRLSAAEVSTVSKLASPFRLHIFGTNY
jgi:hypothetical protein